MFDTDPVTDAVAGHDAVTVCLGGNGLRDKTTLAAEPRRSSRRWSRTMSHASWSCPQQGSVTAGNRPHEGRVCCFAQCFATCSPTTKHRKPSSNTAHWTGPSSGPPSSKTTPPPATTTATKTGPNTRINRADIATALVDQLDDTTYGRTAISVTN